MNTKNTMAAAALAALGLVAAAWAQGPGGGRMAGPPPRGAGFGRGGDGPGRPMSFAPAENPEIAAARRECRELARKARAAESDEERAALKEQLREKVRAETELVDRLHEKRLDAIAEAAQKRIEALRAQLADMREHREEFVEEEVERLMNGQRGGEGPRGGFPPPPPPDGEGFGDGLPPPPPPPPPMDGRHFGHGPRPRFPDGPDRGLDFGRGDPGEPPADEIPGE